MRLPIGVLKIGESDGISAVQHGVVAHIDTAMRNPLNVFAHRAFKKHDVARLHLVLRNAGAQAVQPLGLDDRYVCIRPYSLRRTSLRESLYEDHCG